MGNGANGDLRLPPHSSEAERAVIGACLILASPADVADYLSPDMFYNVALGKIYAAMLSLHKRGIAADFVTVCSELESRGELWEVGGASAITTLINEKVTSAHLDDYAGMVVDGFEQRQVIEVGTDLVKLGYDGDIDGVIEYASNALDSIGVDLSMNPHVSAVMKDAIEGVEERFGNPDARRLIGWSTGFSTYDHWCDGLQPGHVHVIGAYTGTGKTFFVLNVIANLIQSGARVGVFSTEMPTYQMVYRLLACISGVPTRSIVRGLFSEEEYMRFASARKIIDGSSLWMFDTLYERGYISKWTRRLGLDCVVVDYIQGMLGEEREYERVTNNAHALQKLATPPCSVIITSQLSNESARMGGGSDDIIMGYKGSGAIAAIADMASIMYKEKQGDVLTLFVKKNRHGRTGPILVEADWEVARFVDQGPIGLPAKARASNNGGGVAEELEMTAKQITL